MTPNLAPHTSGHTAGHISGVLLAAGSGRRFGGPKALADTGDGPWVLRALDTLDSLDDGVVVLGAAADRVEALLPPGVRTVRNPDHDLGMGSSLRAGLAALGAEVDAAVIMLVDLPDVPAAAVRRLVDRVWEDSLGGPTRLRGRLARVTYGGRPGHPVLIGADHFDGVMGTATGDRGARDYLATHRVTAVACEDIARGEDVDRNPSA